MLPSWALRSLAVIERWTYLSLIADTQDSICRLVLNRAGGGESFTLFRRHIVILPSTGRGITKRLTDLSPHAIKYSYLCCY